MKKLFVLARASFKFYLNVVWGIGPNRNEKKIILTNCLNCWLVLLIKSTKRAGERFPFNFGPGVFSYKNEFWFKFCNYDFQS